MYNKNDREYELLRAIEENDEPKLLVMALSGVIFNPIISEIIVDALSSKGKGKVKDKLLHSLSEHLAEKRRKGLI